MTIQQPLQFNNQGQINASAPIISNGDLAISGPVFEIEPGWGGKLSFWLKSHFQNLVLPFSAILILTVGLTLYITKVKNTAVQNQLPSQIVNLGVSNTTYNEIAQKGQGVTHLARQALASYLAVTTDNGLTSEHKIYIEDLLQKNARGQLGHETLKVGENINFSKVDIEKAIEKSKKLKKEDLENLSKYVKRINFI